MAIFGKLDKPIIKRKIASFDIETHSKTNTFLMGSVYYNENKHKFFWTAKEMIDWIIKNLKGYWIYATNLEFDFYAMFLKYLKEYPHTPVFRSGLIVVDVFPNERAMKRGQENQRVKFLDTMNYVPYGVAKLGKIINLEKHEKPFFLGKNRLNSAEKEILEKYNLRDSEITYKFVEWFQNELLKINSELDVTISRIALNTFRRNFFKDVWFQPSKEINRFIRQGYYGGRTEVFKRGIAENLYYYDINSLYPSVMLFDIPNPSIYMTKDSCTDYDLNYMGMVEAVVTAPDNMKIPYLPFRKDFKLIFPVGTFKGVFTTYELKIAKRLGYKINHLGFGVLYKESNPIFKEYVEYFYKKRMEYKKQKNPAQLIYKLLLNSLYGKFGQRETTEEFIHISMYNGDLKQIKDIYADTYLKVETEKEESSFVQPIISAYITAYARTKLYFYLIKNNVYYCDTDSIFTKRKIKTSDLLGDMKLEGFLKQAIIVKPKFYYNLFEDGSEFVKIKGARNVTKEDFINIIKNKKSFSFVKFLKYKESVKRKMLVNEKIDLIKEFDTEDNKRDWGKQKFNPDVLQDSEPLKV